MPFRTGFRAATRLIALPLCFDLVLNGATGVSEPQLTAFDDFMNGSLEKWQIPGAALGVSRHGRCNGREDHIRGGDIGPRNPTAVHLYAVPADTMQRRTPSP
jgi:hypothetical protein